MAYNDGMRERKWILYVEDERDLAEEVIEVLEEHDLKVIHSVDYTDAINKAQNQKFDLMIVDIHLRKGMGDSLIKAIKGNLRHINNSTPVIVASSQITEELVHSIGKDIKNALVKPYKIETLIQTVFKLLRMKSPL